MDSTVTTENLVKPVESVSRRAAQILWLRLIKFDVMAQQQGRFSITSMHTLIYASNPFAVVSKEIWDIGKFYYD